MNTAAVIINNWVNNLVQSDKEMISYLTKFKPYISFFHSSIGKQVIKYFTCTVNEFS